MLKAPFNFAPLSRKVVYPEWGSLVSQDVPFSDAVSGEIRLKIEAKTDIFVRNGSTLDKKDSRFSQVDGKYFIPGTTLKGCLRNVVEILGFGRLKQYNKSSFSIRDLNDNTYKELIRNPKVHAGWLCKRAGAFYLYDAGEVKDENRISARELDEALGLDEGSQLGFDAFILGRIASSQRTAVVKYKKLAAILRKDPEFTTSYCDKIAKGERFCMIDDKYLVFTGQSGKREYKKFKHPVGEHKKEGNWVGKYKEFLFEKYPSSDASGWKLVSEKDMQAFKSIHASSDDYTELWKLNLDKGNPIPVFFQQKSDTCHIGLSYMFKYPAKENVESLIKNTYGAEENKPDMADLLFGYIGKELSLKGRVVVGHAFSVAECKERKPQIMLLSSPHASYYPLYLKSNAAPVTWNNTHGQKLEIAGYKRYPVRNNAFSFPNYHRGMQLGKMDSVMIPLQAGSKFACSIRFHNLRKVELGALLYALTLGKYTKRYHNLGACKPYGYGKVAFAYQLYCVNEAGDLVCDTQKGMDYYDAFTAYMNEKVPEWQTSDTVTELFAMAEGIPAGREAEFQYMQMEKKFEDKKINEFVAGKKDYENGERLRKFSEIISAKKF